MIVEDLTLIEKLGKGTFGEVFLTKKKNDPQVYATKKVAKNLVLQEKIKKYFNNEIYLLKNVGHPNIIKLFEIKQTVNNFYLRFEYCNGGGLSNCLASYMKMYGKPFPEEIVQHVMRKIVCGLQYLHKNKIIHRDLKLDNILVHFPTEEDKKALRIMNSEVKIIDFGFARYLQNDDLAQSVLGSPINMDPMILQKLRKIDNQEVFGYDEKADIWSLGTIAYELLIGAPPFDANSYDELLEKINKGHYIIPNNLKLSKQGISFLNGLLQYDPKQRLSVDDLFFHEFLVVDCQKFEKVDLNKLSRQYSNTKELVLSTKEWFFFETPGSNEDSSKISAKMYSENSQSKDTIQKVNERNLAQDKEEDFLGSLIGGLKEIQINKQAGRFI